MELVLGLAQEVVGAAMVGTILWFYARRVRTVRSLRALLLWRRRLRISFSALLRVEHEGRFLLVRQHHQRTDEFGPLGGVYKVLGEGVPEELDFHPPFDDDPDRAREISDDLRGTIPANHLGRFIRWFDARYGRESDALHREVLEELAEAGLAVPDGLIPLRVELLHVAEQGPIRGRERDPVFRRHEVYRLRDGVRRLMTAAEGNPDFRLVTEREIRRGRTSDEEPIGEQSAFLLAPRPPQGNDG